MRKTFYSIVTFIALATSASAVESGKWKVEGSFEPQVRRQLSIFNFQLSTSPYATGNWFGLRTTLAEEYGLSFYGKYGGAFFGVVDSENGGHGFWGQALNFGASLNFGKLLDEDALEGITLFGHFRWRDHRPNADPAPWVETSLLFMPSPWTTGTKFRVLSFGLEVSSAGFLPVKDMLVLRAGWIQPQAEFLIQPYSTHFLMASIASAKGIGGNIPFSSNGSTWGGTLRAKPVEWAYVKGGLFMSFPKMSDWRNHGLAYRGYGPDTSKNGLWAMGEIGITPAICDLPGKYAIGGYYFGSEHTTYIHKAARDMQYGFYFQADQKLWQPTPAAETPEGKSAKGLSLFNVFSLAPAENHLYPFCFHTGFCYEGLFPKRDADLLLFAVSYGSYSYDKLREDRMAGRREATYTIGMEASYKANINKWLHIQPFVQYIIRPDGTDHVKNAAILGFQTGVSF